MAKKRDPIGEILEEAKQATKDLIGRRSSEGLRDRILILCGLLGDIKIPVEREAEVVAAIGEITIAVSGIISREFFELLIEKIRS